MINILQDQIYVVFETDHEISLLGEFQREAFKVGFEWASGDTTPLYLGVSCVIELNCWYDLTITRRSKVGGGLGTELSIAFVMQKFKELQGSGGGDPEEPDDVDDSFWEEFDD